MNQKKKTGDFIENTGSLAARLLVLVGAVIFMSNLGAIVDVFLHDEIGYFDEEHMIVGGITGLFTLILFGAFALYSSRLEKQVVKYRVVERAAVASEEKYRHLFEDSQDGIFITDADGFFDDINESGVKLFGYNSSEEMKHIKIQDLFLDEAGMREFGHIPELQDHLKDNAVNMKRKEGSHLIVSMSVESVRDGRGQIVSYRGIFHDITAQKRMEQQLLQSQKMDSISRLAGGVAHDFNNYLTTIQGYVDVAMMELPPDSSLRANLSGLHKATEAAGELTGQLLLFSRHGTIEMQPVQVNKMVRNLGRMMQKLVDEDVRIVTHLDDKLDLVMGDGGSLSQAIVNLALNANANMHNGGDITITTCNGEIGENYLKDHSNARPGDFVTISVSDSGPGIDEEKLASVFEPFCQSSEDGKSAGLGLSAVYGVILQHDGWIDADSIPGMGTTFTIFLPAAKKAELEVEEDFDTAGFDSLRSQGERILLVEDNDAVREITGKMLRECGYEVVGAHDAAEAFARFAGEKGDFQLVFSDIVLPGDDGVTLVENLKSHKPELAVLLVSGYADSAVDWNTVESRGYRFLQKPYVMPELLKAIRELLTNTS